MSQSSRLQRLCHVYGFCELKQTPLLSPTIKCLQRMQWKPIAWSANVVLKILTIYRTACFHQAKKIWGQGQRSTRLVAEHRCTSPSSIQNQLDFLWLKMLQKFLTLWIQLKPWSLGMWVNKSGFSYLVSISLYEMWHLLFWVMKAGVCQIQIKIF